MQYMQVNVKQIFKHLLVLVAQSCPTLCNPMVCRPPSVYGILQARMLEWVAIPFSRGFSQPRDQTQVSCIAGRFFTIWAIREDPFKHLLRANRQYLRKTSSEESKKALEGVLWFPAINLKPIQALISHLKSREK